MKKLPFIVTTAVFIAVLFLSAFRNKDEEPLKDVIVYKYDKEKSLYGYRIPALVTTKNGILLAFAERRVGMNDHAENDIVLRRSLDNGQSWEKEVIIAEEGKASLNDPCPVILENGTILLIYQYYPYGIHTFSSGYIQIADEGYDGPRNTRTFIIQSHDEGKTWSKPREITKSVRASSILSVGCPGTGIQLTRGDFKGRIIIPMYEFCPSKDNEWSFRNSIAFSDDNGETWKVSNQIPHNGLTGYGDEAQAVELKDGSILFIARNEQGFYKKVSVGTDGGMTWKNMDIDLGLPGTACQGTVIRYSWPESGESLIVQASAANKYRRTDGTVRISDDEGKSWKYSRDLVPGSYSYSCLSKLRTGMIGLLYETVVDGKSTINFTSFSTDYIKSGDPPKKTAPYFNIPLIDLDGDTHRQVIVDKEKGQYLGHPTTVLLEDNKTILTVYPKGHGRGGIVYKKSTDAGLTWSDRLPTPPSWATSMEVPTLYPVTDKYGKKRLVMFSGLYPTRMAVSEDNGNTWGELEQVGDWGGIVVMGCMIPLKTGKGHYMTFFHDDMRYFDKNGQKKFEEDVKNFKSRMFTLYKSVTEDGGLTWSFPEVITKSRELHICEPGIIRSPDGKQIAILLRENSRRDNSQIIFSENEGKTWTTPRPLPNSLTGDRHVCRYLPDGRLIVFFRDVSPSKYHSDLLKIALERKETDYSLIARETGYGSPTEGDWVAWVGTYEDLVNRKEGQYRIRIKDNKKGWDTTYPAVELLNDGTIVTTTYGHWEKEEQPYILSVRFKIDEIDEKARKLK
jgi:Neuraminidase (sialidase)